MKSVIEIEGLSKAYTLAKQTIPVLKHIDLRVDHGEFVCLMGPSGSGKTTLLNIIGLLDGPSGGSYRFNGDDVTALNDDARSRMRNLEIGFVFQTFNLLPSSNVLRNVELPLFYGHASNGRKRALELLERVGLSDRLKHLPQELSGGQCQRVAIARALVMDPSIILADEPTGNLDSQAGEEIMDLFAELNDQGKTIIMVTHEEHIARYAQRIVRLKDGMIVTGRSSPRRLRELEGVLGGGAPKDRRD